jgi:hypothetical protein
MDIFGPEIGFLEELAEDLKSIFLVIAYAGHETNIKYIKDSQAYIVRKYGMPFHYVQSDVGIRYILPACWVLEGLLEGNPSPEEIREECANALGDYLFFDDPEGFPEDFGII